VALEVLEVSVVSVDLELWVDNQEASRCLVPLVPLLMHQLDLNPSQLAVLLALNNLIPSLLWEEWEALTPS
jgi:hypothetical protein